MSYVPFLVLLAVVILMVWLINRTPKISIKILEGEVGLVFVNNKFDELLQPGTYSYKSTNTNIEVRDVGTQQIAIFQVPAFTQDGIKLHVNAKLLYKITDPIKAFVECDALRVVLEAEVEEALSDTLAKFSLDHFMENRTDVSAVFRDLVDENVIRWGVELIKCSFSDVEIPKHLFNAYNKVLASKLSAQARVEKTKGEVASLELLSSVAHLLDDNDHLFKLKLLANVVNRSNDGELNINIQGNELKL